MLKLGRLLVVLSGKKTTQLCDPFTWGEFFCDNINGGKKIFEQIDALLEEGLTPQEISATGTKFAYCYNAIERRYTALMIDRARARSHVACFYHTGAAGSGKSHSYRSLEAEGKSACYSADYLHPFDEYMGEDVLFIDELREGAMSPPMLLSIMEPYRTTLPARYQNRLAVYEELHISSIVPPEEIMLFGEPFSQYSGGLIRSSSISG